MYEQNLKEELFACHMYIKIPFDALDKMPIRDRKYYIHKYNEYMEARNNAIKKANEEAGLTDDDIRFYNTHRGDTYGRRNQAQNAVEDKENPNYSYEDIFGRNITTE